MSAQQITWTAEDGSEHTTVVSASLIRRFTRTMKTLEKLMGDFREVCPEGNLYLEDAGNFCLMAGPSHRGHGEQPQQQNVVTTYTISRCGGGGW